jgi:hypothetical protein
VKERAHLLAVADGAVEGTEPGVVFQGHWHQTNHEQIRDGTTEVFGLNRDGRTGCMAVLNLDGAGRAQFAGKRR